MPSLNDADFDLDPFAFQHISQLVLDTMSLYFDDLTTSYQRTTAHTGRMMEDMETIRHMLSSLTRLFSSHAHLFSIHSSSFQDAFPKQVLELGLRYLESMPDISSRRRSMYSLLCRRYISDVIQWAYEMGGRKEWIRQEMLKVRQSAV